MGIGFLFYLGLDSKKVEPFKIVVSGLLFVLWSFVFPGIAGENVVVTSYHKLYMILIWGMTNVISTFLAVIILGKKKPENAAQKILIRATIYSIAMIIISGFLVGTIILNNLEISIEVRTLIFGFLFPVVKLIFHHFMTGVFSFLGRNFDEEKLTDFISIVNMMVEVTCNLAQMV